MDKAVPKNKKSRLLKGALCLAFAAVALSGCGLAQHQTGSQHNNSPAATSTTTSPAVVYPAGPEPGVVQAFGTAATQDSQVYFSTWNAMLQTQQADMSIPADAQSYNSFIATFNKYKGEPLAQMANNVNALEVKDIAYSDYFNCTTPNTDSVNCSTANYFWDTPVQTIMQGKGNCIDQSILQYYIMSSLGVPENRLFVAMVSAVDSTTVADHAVLLLNTAPAGQPQNFLVLNDGGPVMNSTVFEKPLTNETPVGPYTFYAAINQSGVWMTSLGDSTMLPAGNKVAQAVIAKPALPKPAFKIA